VYLINFLNLQTAQQLFIAVGRYRTGQGLLGAKDGVNLVYTTPSSENFVHNLPFLSIQVYYNGVRQTLLDDYTVSESGGVGTGFDTITMGVPMRPGDKLIADYIITTP